jgi:hypothetical protein
MQDEHWKRSDPTHVTGIFFLQVPDPSQKPFTEEHSVGIEFQEIGMQASPYPYFHPEGEIQLLNPFSIMCIKVQSCTFFNYPAPDQIPCK